MLLADMLQQARVCFCFKSRKQCHSENDSFLQLSRVRGNSNSFCASLQTPVRGSSKVQAHDTLLIFVLCFKVMEEKTSALDNPSSDGYQFADQGTSHLQALLHTIQYRKTLKAHCE